MPSSNRSFIPKSHLDVMQMRVDDEHTNTSVDMIIPLRLNELSFQWRRHMSRERHEHSSDHNSAEAASVNDERPAVHCHWPNLPAELLQMVLLELPHVDLLLAQGVCKTWAQTIQTSHTIQCKLFFKPTDRSTEPWKLNPLMCRAGLIVERNQDCYPYFVGGLFLFTAPKPLLEPTASWRKMLLTNHANPCVHANFDQLPLRQCRLNFPNTGTCGVKAGSLSSALIQLNLCEAAFADEHGDYRCFANWLISRGPSDFATSDTVLLSDSEADFYHLALAGSNF